MDSNQIVQDAERRMNSAVESMLHDFSTYRTGRASPAVLERVHVEYYGTDTPVSQLANIGDKYVLAMSFEENSAALIDLSTGRVAGQIVFGEDETLVAPPISTNGWIFLLTDRSSYLYSLNGCPSNKETVTDQTPATVLLK